MFPKIFDAIWSFAKARIFLIPLFIAFSNQKILDFLFRRKIALPGNWNAKNWALENCKEYIRYTLKIAPEWIGV